MRRLKSEVWLRFRDDGVVLFLLHEDEHIQTNVTLHEYKSPSC